MPLLMMPMPNRETLGEKQTSTCTYHLVTLQQTLPNASVRVTPCCLAHVVGSPFRNGNSVGNAIIGRPSVLNSLTTLPSLDEI